MPDPTHAPLRLALVALAAAGGGAVNAIAGGGTLLTFPALVALGIDPLVANATSTVALWPGQVSSIWGYREAIRGARAWAVRWAAPSVLGGLVGALLLMRTSRERFALIVPWLVLGATLLFLAQRGIVTLAGRRRTERPRGDAAGPDAGGSGGGGGGPVEVDAPGRPLPPPPAPFLAYQFAVAVYGGYFGAGLGILMLAALGFMGLTDIHRMNGLKNWGGLCANAVAVAVFAASGVVDWPVALTMGVGAIAGGWGGARLAQRVPQQRVRQAIVAIGLASAAWLFVRG